MTIETTPEAGKAAVTPADGDFLRLVTAGGNSRLASAAASFAMFQGGIVDVIENANGTAIRWESGLQVVYRRSDLTHSDVTVSASSIILASSHAANFNASPVGLPFVGIRVQSGSMTPFRGLTNTHFATMTATNVSLAFRKADSVTEGFDDTGIDTNDNPASNFMGYVAIGTWK